MADRYWLKSSWEDKSKEVSRKKWIKAERRAGFRPKLPSDDPRYMQVCATGGFRSGDVCGIITTN